MTSEAQRVNPDWCFYTRQESNLFWLLILSLFYFVFVNECGLAQLSFQSLSLALELNYGAKNLWKSYKGQNRITPPKCLQS